MCSVFKVSRSGYYNWLNRRPSTRTLETQKLKKMIKDIYQESKGRYGSPKITEKLKSMNLKISRQRVARLMRSENIKSIIHKKYKVSTTDSNHDYPIAENHLKRNFKAQTLDKFGSQI